MLGISKSVQLNYFATRKLYQCDNLQCISSEYVCDGKYRQDGPWYGIGNGCFDGSDESHCESWKCLPGLWKCADFKCIDFRFVCDGIADCLDRSDEVDCKEYECLPDHWKCANNSVGPVLSSTD